MLFHRSVNLVFVSLYLYVQCTVWWEQVRMAAVSDMFVCTMYSMLGAGQNGCSVWHVCMYNVQYVGSRSEWLQCLTCLLLPPLFSFKGCSSVDWHWKSNRLVRHMDLWIYSQHCGGGVPLRSRNVSKTLENTLQNSFVQFIPGKLQML